MSGMLKYEWKLAKYQHCKLFGHKDLECRKKNITRRVWRLMQQVKEQVIEPIAKQTPAQQKGGWKRFYKAKEMMQ